MTAPSCSMNAQIDPRSSPRPNMAPNGPQDEPPTLPHLFPSSSKTILCAMIFGYFQVWLPLFTRMCHQCVEKRAMTPPRGPMDAQTDPRSSPTEPKRGPNKPQHEHHEFPKLSHVRPEVSNTMVSHGLYMLLCSTALVHPHAAPMCPDLQTND